MATVEVSKFHLVPELLQLVFKFGLGAALCLAASAGPVHSASVKRLRIAQIEGDFYRSVTSHCVAALSESARGRGVTIDVIDRYRDDFKNTPKETANIYVLPSVVNLTALRPPGFDALDEVAIFSNPSHVANFLQSNYYKTSIASVEFTGLFRSKVVGYAYGSTSQLFTADAPIMTPADLSGRTMIGSFRAWWYAALREKLNIGHDPILGHTQNVIAKQREAVIRATNKRRKDAVFILMPILMAQGTVPPELRQYISLTMSHTMLVDLEANNWFDLDDEGKRIVQVIVDDAIVKCSEQNFAAEKKALEALAASGSTVVPVDIEPFQALSKDKFAKRRVEAKAEDNKSLLETLDEQQSAYDAIQRLN